MLDNSFARFAGVRVHQPKDDALLGEPRIKPLYFRRVTIGDGTIVADENKNNSSRGFVGEWIYGAIMEVRYPWTRYGTAQQA